MSQISLTAPAWFSTFPHRVIPASDEWFAGLLLRCDEVNHWSSGTTSLYLVQAITHHPARSRLNVIAPAYDYLEHLSQVFAISTSVLVATTYQAEINRLSSFPYRPLLQSNSSFRFSFCPQCVAQARMLLRSVILPQLTICPHHDLIFQDECLCGFRLTLFTRQTPPFTCPACGRDWGNLPHIQASPEQIVRKQQILSYYAFFFSQGTFDLYASTISLIEEQMALKEHRQLPRVGGSFYQGAMSLSGMVSSLLRLNLSLEDVVAYAASRSS